MANHLPDPILELIIRFTQSLSDVTLQIASPRTTTTLSLKQLIRTHLPPAYTDRRLRLIHAGKVLPDRGALSTSLNLAAQRNTLPPDDKPSRKGKQPVRAAPPLRLYIHCSIGDALPASDLSAETAAATAADDALRSPQSAAQQHAQITQRAGETPDGGVRRTSTAAPRGFDRLLTTGFSPAEVAALRSQFLNVIAHTHTPDSMPSGADLLRLEDRWLDNDGNGGAAPGAEGGEGAETWGADDGSALDDFLWGNVIGFFWPLGALVWGFREDGVWARRRQIAVFTGLLINLVFGFARMTS